MISKGIKVNQKGGHKMADVTWGVKVPEEMKDKIAQTMRETGLSGKEFVDAMFNAYIIKETKENQPVMVPDLEELQTITGRMVAIYASLGERVGNMLKEKDTIREEEIQQREKTISALTEKITNVEETLESALTEKEEANTYALELKKQQKDMEEALETHKALVAEYREKNDTLTGMLTECQEQKEKFGQLQEMLAEQKTKNQRLTVQLEGFQKDIETAKEEIERLKIDHKKDIETIKEKKELEKEKAVLAIRAETQDRIEEVQAQANEKIQALLSKVGQLQEKLSGQAAEK
jgi:DNA repair exonuclease SbcCD ATPase subunit